MSFRFHFAIDHKVVTLSLEREDILREVQALRRSSATDGDNDDGGIGERGGFLTDPETARSHDRAMNKIALLLRGMGARRAAGEDDVSEEQRMGEEIMGLVSKIISQRVVLPAAQEGGEPPPGETEENGEVAVKEDGESNRGDDDDEGQEASDQEDNERGISHRRASVHSVRGLERVSVSSALSESVHDGDAYDNQPYVISHDSLASSNSLFDGTSPCVVSLDGKGDDDGGGDDDDDSKDTSSLGIIHEYDDIDSEAGTAYGKQRQQAPLALSSSARQGYGNNDGDYDSYDDESYVFDRNSHEGDQCYSPNFSDDIEYPPSGYHRYSPSPSARSRYSSKSRRHSQHSSRYSSSEGSGHRRPGHEKSSRSNSSSYSRSKKEREARKNIERKEHLKAQGRDGEFPVASEKIDKSQIVDPQQLDQEDILVNTIEGHLASTVLMKPSRDNANTPGSPCASAFAESSENPSEPASEESSENPSFETSNGGDSTKESKGIAITVISRASKHVSFPSTPAHTYVTFFHAALSKSQVDAVLEEQFSQTREALEDGCTGGPDGQGRQRMTKRRKYQGEYNEEGERHGYGIYTSKNGNEYRGEWQNGNREGLGVVRIGNGDVFEGQFEDNLKNGIGVYHFLDGECDLSCYKDDARVGVSLRYSKDRRSALLLSKDFPGRSKAISLEEAACFAKEMGAVVVF